MAVNKMEIIGFHLTTEPYGYFSNWFMCGFEYAGKHYNCVEQYMMAKKVELGKRFDLMDQIMDSNDPDEIKKLAGKNCYPEYAQIAGYWEKHRKHIVKRGVKAKFLQNAELQKKLLGTGNSILAECAGKDKVWGIGITLSDKAWHDVSNWNGDNLLGMALMEVRDEIWQEIALNGTAKYTDYRDALPIPEWNCKSGLLKRIPQYYSAINTYADQLPEGKMRDTFYGWTLSQIENAMRTNMGGGLPIAGFFEMKQEIYEIARRLGFSDNQR